MPAANALAVYSAPRRSSKAARRSAEGRTRRRRGARKCFFSCRFVVASLGFQSGPRFASAAPSGLPVRPLCRTPPSHMENPAFARILLKTTRINRNAAGTSGGKRETFLFPENRRRSPYSYAGDTTICGKKIKRGGQEMPAIRPRGRAGRRMSRYPMCTGKHKRGCTGSNGVLSSVVPAKWRFGAVPTAGISIGGTSAARGDAAIAGRPSAPSSQPAQHGAQARPARFKESVSGANATLPIRPCAAAGLRAVTAKTTRTAALLVSFFAALPSGLPSGGGFAAISLCFLQPARS